MSLLSANVRPARVTAISSADIIARPVRPPTLTAATLASTDHELTVIIPAYNERRRLPKTLAALAEFLNASRIDYRVMVADDGSRDGTAKLTNGLGPRFSTLRLEHNAGKGCAVRTAMLAATGQVVAFTDADLPYDLTALRQAYEWIRQGQCEVALGTRNARKSAGLDQRRWIRKVATRAFSAVVKQLVSKELCDTQCGLKLFSRRAAVEIFSRAQIDGFAFDAEVVLLALRLRLACRSLPVILINEQASTVSLMRNAIPMLLDVIKVRFRLGRHPLMPCLNDDWGRLPSDRLQHVA